MESSQFFSPSWKFPITHISASSPFVLKNKPYCPQHLHKYLHTALEAPASCCWDTCMYMCGRSNLRTFPPLSLDCTLQCTYDLVGSINDAFDGEKSLASQHTCLCAQKFRTRVTKSISSPFSAHVILTNPGS